MLEKFKLGIVGYGFVGKAVDYGFTHRHVEKFYCDPKEGTDIDQLTAWQPNGVFVCAPTPMNIDGTVNATIVEDAVLKLLQHTECLIIIKSTITPSIVQRIMMTAKMQDCEQRVVYNPEFLTENSALEQFVRSKLTIFGGLQEAVNSAEWLYNTFSSVAFDRVIKVPAVEAAFIKYGINSYLATKVTFMNQFHDMVDEFGADYNMVMKAMECDERIGTSHNRVPGPDGKQGFGGACFPKDTLAITKTTKKLTLLEECIRINNEYRSQYELDEREKSNNVNYGQTKEEQQDKDNRRLI